MRAAPTLYFIRHGETDWNAARRYQGQADIPLNDTGRAQAARNGRALAQIVPSVGALHFVASPLSRTCETMRIVRGELGLDPESFATDNRIIELHYGHWQGELQSDLGTVDPDGVAARHADPFHWRPRGGENYTDLTRRLNGWLDDLAEAAVVVSHGGVSRALRGMLVHGVGERDVPRLAVPQDRVLVIDNGRICWL
ncbi:MAG: histidine phosphatase family protein [Hyphomicrobiaceae bacterium]